jgi:hypothetical protein
VGQKIAQVPASGLPSRERIRYVWRSFRSMSPFPFLSHNHFLIIEIPKVPEKSLEQQLWL